MTSEKVYRPVSGWPVLVILLAAVVFGIGLFVNTILEAEHRAGSLNAWLIFASFAVLTIAFLGMFGFLAIQPNEARVLLLFGNYKGTVRESGFFFVNPFFSKKPISLRIRNFETGSIHTAEQKNQAGQVVQQKSRSAGRPSKVNDRDGNPIEISAVVVWRVVETAEALFEVDDYEDFVAVQSEAALRSLATRHPYDSEDHEVSLRGSMDEICDQLRLDIQERLSRAGMEVIEARISHLAYAAEIAAAMLQRQQAHAVVAARTKIVDGAVGMVQMALDRLSNEQVIELDPERRAAMVSNLLVVLCSDRHTQPIINAGSTH
ncbi:MAG: SPFH domain-containing protein [Planctomycetaceae bacterium]